MIFLGCIKLGAAGTEVGSKGDSPEIFSLDNREDIRDATHTPKREGRHLSLTFGTVLGGNVYQRHICYQCATDGLYA